MANKSLQSIKFPDLPDTYTVPVVDNTLAVSGAAADAKQTGDSLADKVDKVSGKGLSTNDYTDGEKTKLAGIETGATKTIVDNTLTVTGNAADAKAVGDAIASEDKKALAAFTTDIASGAVANFPDGADSIPMKDVVVHIEPVQAGSGDPSPDNVRPITGWTGANISRAGKNLCINTNFVAGEVDGITYIMNDDGSINCNGTSTGTANKWLLNNNSRYILPSGNYILSGGANVSSRGMRVVVSINRISGTIEYINATSSADVPFAINDGDTIRGIYLRISESTVLVSNVTIYPMIRPAAFTDNTYEPYAAPAIYNVSFPSEAGTVYGGTLDVTSGVLTVDRAMINLGTWNWTMISVAQGNLFRTPSIVNAALQYDGLNIICSNYPTVKASQRQDKTMSIGSDNRVDIIDSSYSDASAFKTAMNGVQLVYELATPITYTLTPQEITSLLGTNNLWADTGDSEVEYCVDPTLLLDNESSEIQSIKSMIAGVESSAVATKNYSIGDLVIVEDTLYEVTAVIASGETISVSNARVTTVDDTIKNRIADSIDDTLTQSGQAADSKAVGDKFESITAKTRNIADVGIGRYSFNNNTGVISHQPSNANILGLSDKIACEPETEYAVTLYTANNISSPIGFYVAFYSETEYLSQIYMPNRMRNVVKTPANIKYFCVYWYNGTGIPFDDNTHIQIEEGYISTEYIAPTCGYDVVARQGETVNIPYTEHKGYFEASGNIANQTSSKEYYTEKIDIALFKSIGASVEYPTEQSLWLACATYDENGDFIERVVFANLANTRAYGQSINVNNNVRYMAFTYRKFDNGILKIFGSLSESGVAAKIISHSATKASLADGFQFRFKPCYDHLFVSKSAENTVIPHESLYHVRISKALGFNIIEANIASTSDGVYIVNHLNSGKFGKYFHHADGQTDISDIAVSSVTWDWICQNARYNSTLKKYQTRPSRVEEFLSECRQQNIIPFIYSADPAVLEIADSYMGKNNYIAYGAKREKCPTAIIYHWVTKTSKEEIIEYCEQVGKPLIYGMSNPTAFTDAELREIIDALHTRGFWIGCSYADYEWHKYSAMGFDLNGTQLAINRMQCGNLYNFDTLLSFDDFNVTGASEVDGELVFSTNGTIEPDINDTILSLGAVDIEISFSGTITMHGIGERTVAYTYTSDGTLPFFVATPIIGGSPKFTADVTSGTIVKDIKYKASKL